ncbi:hypothetical protein COV24_00680 [candidate division WWE3 bacterium CG10_big_fil_rev_8_21_14_0_10_32_10]|uniref:Uncharacterized protein n=1 Tax=candidate division WWE3 bacterium CG10_big_fil_rev_8_21_14_0_10_32_10 TaxID=1975090 RepID=A0A2H0RBT4_UNCKA|nr:MAG: hypothetical protein COV24_00680 [candidate division WWE3 bacterium CG10_big_fil_rev_8_21_14_0_10_32_10]
MEVLPNQNNNVSQVPNEPSSIPPVQKVSDVSKPIPPSVGNTKKFVIVLLLVVLFAGVAVLAFSLSNKKSSDVIKKKDIVQTDVTVTPTPLVTTTPTDTMSLLPGQKKYTSKNLGVSFLYMEEMPLDSTFKVMIQEIDNKIYVYGSNFEPTTGQYIEVFNKDPNMTLEQALSQDFLNTAEYQQSCAISSVSPDNTYPSTMSVANIILKNNFEDLEKRFEELKKCPSPYTQSNGISYFIYDFSYPTKYAFVSIGQYSIPSDTNGTTWQNTIKFTN